MMSWPGIAFGLPSRVNLPMRGPMMMRHRQRGDAADRVDDAGAGEVRIAMAQPEVGAERREPAAAPRPVGEQRINERAHEERRDDEGRVLPALGGGAGDDGERGVHEHHLEEEHHHDADVIGAACMSNMPFVPNRPQSLPNRCIVYSELSGGVPPRLATAPTPPFLDREADQPVGEHADAVHHEVHHHGVVGVLGAAQTGLDDREAGLHEHDEEAA